MGRWIPGADCWGDTAPTDRSPWGGCPTKTPSCHQLLTQDWNIDKGFLLNFGQGLKSYARYISPYLV